MSVFMGIDIGSLTSKGVVITDISLSASFITLSGINYRATAEKIHDELLSLCGFSMNDISRVVATGCGGGNVYFAGQRVSDMVCTARGINVVFPQVRTVIDIAAQSSKVMHINELGMVVDFSISERCASGSGHYVEVIANVLRIDLNDFGTLSLRSKNPVTFSTGCAVFGESEAITRVAEGIPKEDIAAGVNKALAEKISSMIKKIGLAEPCAICGGGSLNIGLVRALEKELDEKLLVPEKPQIIAALGAANIARTSDFNNYPR